MVQSVTVVQTELHFMSAKKLFVSVGNQSSRLVVGYRFHAFICLIKINVESGKKNPTCSSFSVVSHCVSVCSSFTTISSPCMHFLYILLLSVLQFEALSCISSCWQQGPGSWVGDPTDESLLLLIPRALVTEPEPLQHQLETWRFSLRCNTTLCYHSQGLKLIVLFAGHHSS